MAITSHDVARLAGVSQATVSRALRNDVKVSATTRDKVTAAAKQLGYVRSEVGRSLSTRSTHQIAMVADLDNPLYPRLVAPLHDALMDLKYRMVVYAERGDEMSPYERLLDGSVDGAILTTTQLRSSLPYMLHQRGFPFVQMNRVSALVDVDSVTADNYAGAQDVGRLLRSEGHTRIGAIFGPDETSSSRDREAGFRAALDEVGLELPPRRVSRGTFMYEDGRNGLTKLMSRPDRPTAVFCVTDILAVGALNAASELGLQVPKDVAIVGFDDLDVAAWPCFQLTTVRVDFARMARQAAQRIIAHVGGDADASVVHETVPTELVFRSTHVSGTTTQNAANHLSVDGRPANGPPTC